MRANANNATEKLARSNRADKVSLYQQRQKIFVHYVGGYWQNLRLYTGWPLLLGYFLIPWIQWNGRQAVLFDLPARKFYIFGLTFWPQDLVLLAFILMISAFTLFFVTSLVGRLWCGYTCPQTIWTAIFMWVEKRTEGSRNQRLRLDRQPWNMNKILRRSSKHILWLGFSVLTGFTFIAYFYPARELLFDAFNLQVSMWGVLWILLFTLATYINAGWLREQVCIYVCPYARFQSAMIDKSTLVVAYDKLRGEPRGSRSRKSSNKELGDCVNCQLCVQVCPTGIDIREGLQIECIQCAHCIDACDQVMQKMNYAKGLIRYDSEENMLSKGHSGVRLWRPRTIGYAVVLLLMMALFVLKLSNRVPFSVDVSRERGALFHEVAGAIRNDYTLKVTNKSQQDYAFELTASSTDIEPQLGGDRVFEVAAGEVQTRIISLSVEKDQLAHSLNSVELTLCETGREQCLSVENRFLGPQ